MASSRITVFLAAGVYPEVASHIVCDVAGARAELSSTGREVTIFGVSRRRLRFLLWCFERRRAASVSGLTWLTLLVPSSATVPLLDRWSAWTLEREHASALRTVLAAGTAR
ncbi:hypothetical protein ATK17_3919 [Branchiibius hedensis]|uniref:Uncharacterized protein n=1 Tax=Branchiibius hedensis TaxID=672460 RepID=A0A2Y9BNE2_9MICO|nr:hypothetical protein ATK17_3919 [Branchiibius hedensis]SSA59104.1 hypothetical protein SAMN04489750_3919 [Branchiibius hedensis]